MMPRVSLPLLHWEESEKKKLSSKKLSLFWATWKLTASEDVAARLEVVSFLGNAGGQYEATAKNTVMCQSLLHN